MCSPEVLKERLIDVASLQKKNITLVDGFRVMVNLHVHDIFHTNKYGDVLSVAAELHVYTKSDRVPKMLQIAGTKLIVLNPVLFSVIFDADGVFIYVMASAASAVTILSHC